MVVKRDGLNSLFVSFLDNDIQAGTTDWASNTTDVPFLETVSTAQAPASVVAALSQLTAGTSTAGPLIQAIEQVMAGERILWVTCSGEGPGGGLAILCGVAASLNFPLAGVDVITFGTPWIGFNPPFAWVFDRQISLFYLWPFTTATEPPPPVSLVPPPQPELWYGGSDELKQLADGVQQLVTADGVLEEAMTIPNLPPATPAGADAITSKENIVDPPGSYDEKVDACYKSFAGQPYGDTPVCLANSPKIKLLGNLAPVVPGIAPSDCPVFVCKARPYLAMSCTGFRVDTAAGPPPSLMVGAAYACMVYTRQMPCIMPL